MNAQLGIGHGAREALLKVFGKPDRHGRISARGAGGNGSGSWVTKDLDDPSRYPEPRLCGLGVRVVEGSGVCILKDLQIYCRELLNLSATESDLVEYRRTQPVVLQPAGITVPGRISFEQLFKLPATKPNILDIDRGLTRQGDSLTNEGLGRGYAAAGRTRSSAA